MTHSEFQSFVASNARSFAGVNPESRESLDDAERKLGLPLPDEMKWLLEVYGYSFACGISSLKDSVASTHRCREKFSLPHRIVVLNDWGDSGVVYWDRESGVVRWGDASDLYLLAEGKHAIGCETYDDYPAWTKARLQDEENEK